MQDLSAKITELTKSDKELKSMIDQHAETVQQHLIEKDSAERKLADEGDSLAAFERKRSLAQTARGKLEAEKQRHKEVIDYRHRLIRDLSLKHNIPGFDHNLSPSEMDDFVDRLEQNIVNQSNKIDHIKVSPLRRSSGAVVRLGADLVLSAGCWTRRAGRAAGQDYGDQDFPGRRREDKARTLGLNRKQDHISRFGCVRASLMAHLWMQKLTKQTIDKLRRKLDSSTLTQADVSYMEATLADESKRKADAEAQLASPELSNKQAEYARELKLAEEHREELHTELASLNAQADVRAKLSLKRAEAAKKDNAIQALVDKHSAVFTKLTRKAIEKTTMEAEVNGVVSQLSAEQAAAERSATAAAKELQAVETKVSFTKDKAETLRSDIAGELAPLLPAGAYFGADTFLGHNFAEHRARISSGTSSLDVQYSTVKENLDDAEQEVDAARK